MNFSLDQIIELFNQALEKSPEERTACLDDACAGDANLRESLEGLLRAYASAGTFLEQEMKLLRPGEPIGEGPGQLVGRYKLLEQIGEGGCGIVFLAEQEEPVKRQVALKIVKPGMDTRSVIARFESERQALAMMEHPHIARVFDAGATATGRPYFVMELVRGMRITDYCRAHSLALKERLELFAEICHAVQHAHQKGIIHRDIKPSNILVSTTAEGRHLPKVIDFGIAKATTGEPLGDRTLVTSFEVLIGTPDYMSPEQAAMKSADLDTRTDIYSLGVLLYEMLTGVTPFGSRDPFRSGLDELRRDIMNQEPAAPSARLKAMPADDRAAVANACQIEPERLVRTIRGDLDWIVMTALEKDRARRYPTANALATDVLHHLADEPVAARPPSTGYRLGKLVARNRLLAGSITVVSLLLLVGLTTTTVLLTRERAAHQQAETEKHAARVAAAKSDQVSQFLGKMLRSVSPSVAMGRDTTILRELLTQTDQEITRELPDQPEVEATLRRVLGDAYRDLGDHPSAERMLRRALELSSATSPPDRRETATVMTTLSHVLISDDRYDEAERLLLSASDLWRELGAEEEQGSMVTMEKLGVLRSRQHRDDEALALMQRVYAWRRKNLKPDDPELVGVLANLAVIASAAKKYPEAERMFLQVLETNERSYGAEHPSLAITLSNLSKVCSVQGKVDEEKKYLLRAVALYRKTFQPAHPKRLEASLKLAELHRKDGEFSQAETLLREVLENGRSTPEDYNPAIDVAIGSLVVVLHAQNRTAEADALLAGLLKPEFAGSPQFVPVLNMRVEFLARTGRWREAAEDAARLVAMEPDRPEPYHTLAPLLAAAGDDTAYRELCAVMLSRFAPGADGANAGRLAKDCLIRPGSVKDLTVVNRMADFALKALVEFRDGNFTAAAEHAAEAAASRPDSNVEALAVRAMSLQRMNRTEEARAALASCSAAFDSTLPQPGAPDLGDQWRDWIVARQLLDEAHSLIQGKQPQ